MTTRGTHDGSPALTIVVPTLDEAGNIQALVDRLTATLRGMPVEVVFVDDSSDATAAEVRRVGARPGAQVVLVQRDVATRWGGLGGAVVDGLRLARTELVCVMDADLQHPPETVPLLLEQAQQTGADVVIATRSGPGGGSRSGPHRRAVSRVSTMLARAILGERLRRVSDPLSGFFLVRKDAVPLDELRPRGFKILLEILVRSGGLRVDEIGYVFAVRNAERSKASLRTAVTYLRHLVELRRGRVQRHRPAALPVGERISVDIEP